MPAQLHYAFIINYRFGALKAERIEVVELKTAEPEEEALPRDILFKEEGTERKL